MPRLPIICQHCGAVFLSGFNIQPGGTLSYLSGSIETNCPSCGKWTGPPHGVYQGINDTAIAFAQRRLSQSELRRLAEKLRGIVEQKLSPEEAASAIRSEKKTELPRLADLLPKTRIELYAFLSLLILFLTFLLKTVCSGPEQNRPAVQVETIINNFYESLERSPRPRQPESPEPPC